MIQMKFKPTMWFNTVCSKITADLNWEVGNKIKSCSLACGYSETFVTEVFNYRFTQIESVLPQNTQEIPLFIYPLKH